MSYYKVGDTSNGICIKCKTIVPTTYKFNKGFCCNYCGRLLGIPQQSFQKQDINKLPKVKK